MKTNILVGLRATKALGVITFTLISGYSWGTPVAQAITFNFRPASGTPQPVVDGFTTAGNLWSSHFSDNVTLNIDIAFAALEGGVLGQAVSTETTVSYQNFYSALRSNITSNAGRQALNSLPNSSTFDLLINYTSNSPHGYGSATPYLDNNGSSNNQRIRMTTANAKALGLVNAQQSSRDATVAMNSSVSWDFDRSNNISSNAFDFVGAAAHELGHVLGFISGVDFLDAYSPFSVNGNSFFFPENSFTTVSPLDLFRFSRDSVAYGAGVIDWTASSTPKYFSIDGGQTAIASFATGESRGDGESASHWQARQGIGIMDPLARPGQLLRISNTDLLAFDVIGWDLVRNASVESPTLVAGLTTNLVQDTVTSTSPLAPALKVDEPVEVVASEPDFLEAVPEPDAPIESDMTGPFQPLEPDIMVPFQPIEPDIFISIDSLAGLEVSSEPVELGAIAIAPPTEQPEAIALLEPFQSVEPDVIEPDIIVPDIITPIRPVEPDIWVPAEWDAIEIGMPMLFAARGSNLRSTATVPEPASVLSLLGLGILGAGSLLRKKSSAV